MPTWNIEFKIHAPIKLHQSLHRQTRSAIKVANEDSIITTNITLREAPNERNVRYGYFSVIFTVSASTQKKALDAGKVYASQLCDLLSFITRVSAQPEIDEDSRNTVNPRSRFAPTADRLLLAEEWDWIIRSLANLNLKEPQLMAACSWYRRGLCCDDVTEKICCYWRVIERCAISCCNELGTDGYIKIIPTVDKFIKEYISKPCALLANKKNWKEVYSLRNIISHGSEPLSPRLIDKCSSYEEETEEAAYCALSNVIAELSKKELFLGLNLQSNEDYIEEMDRL